jgi:hypothetical protein
VTSGSQDGVTIRFVDAKTQRALVLEDDGRVAYAYLLVGEEIVADVWLYNVAATPRRPDWRCDSLPFLNPARHCRADETLPRIASAANLSCTWSPDGVELFIDGVLAARLSTGSTPGESRLARDRGPLARPLR